MAWIKIREELEGHPKLTDLMNLMEWEKDKALGNLVRFWIWCSRYADDGDLRRHNDDRLGATVGCRPGEDSKRFVEAMVTACWLEREPYFRVHDWWDHFGDFLKSKYTHSSEKWKYVKRLYSKGLARAKPAKIDREDREDRKIDKVPRKSAVPEGYKKLIEHITKTYEAKKGHKYPFRAIDGGVVKRLLGLYNMAQVMALWDIFLDKSWDWMKDGELVKCAHDLRQFQSKITIILEDSLWRDKADKYQGKIDMGVAPLVGQVGQKIEHVKSDPLEGKIESLKGLKQGVQ